MTPLKAEAIVPQVPYVEHTHYVPDWQSAAIAREMKRLGLTALGVSKTRWTGAGKVQLASGETELKERNC